MQIFCDESGGTNSINDVFLVAAVAIEGTDAQRIMKDFRKASKLKGECKGSTLSIQDRSMFFDIINKQNGTVSSAVICSRSETIGAWAFNNIEEYNIYTYLMQEACLSIGSKNPKFLNIVPDGGRYKKSKLDQIREALQSEIEAANPDSRVTINYGNSAEIAGLQIVDIIANSVFQMLGPSPSISQSVETLLRPSIQANALSIRDVRMPSVRPAWIP